LTRSKKEADPWQFFLPKGKKLENLGFLGEIFHAQTLAKYG